MRTPASLLAILGDTSQYGAVVDWIRRRGLVVSIATTAADGLRLYAQGGAELVLLGLPLPDQHASTILAALRKHDPLANVVVVGTDQDVDSQLDALELGAHDYVADPIDGRRDLFFALGVSLGMRKGDAQLRVLRDKEAASADWRLIVGNCRALRDALAKVRHICERRLAATAPTVLLTGEIGTGKHLFARALHYNGARRGRAFVEVNCSASDDLHALLFGRESGAERGQRVGAFESVDGGTVFLDEVGAIPLAMQDELLAAIEDRQIRRLGSEDWIPIDVQIVASTRRDLAAMVKRGELRADLYHRLNVVAIALPPLRDRGDDVIAIAEALVTRLAVEHAIAPPPRLGEATHAMLKGYAWPGNIRELRNELERVVLAVDDDIIHAEHLRLRSGALVAIAKDGDQLDVVVSGDRCPLERIERELIRQALVRSGNNISRAARFLSITRQTLLYRMKKYGFPGPSSQGMVADDDETP